MSWLDFRLPPGAKGSPWARIDNRALVFFPNGHLRSTPTTAYRFYVHEKLLGARHGRRVIGRFGTQDVPATETGSEGNYTGFSLPARPGFSRLLVVGREKNDYPKICSLSYRSSKPALYLQGARLYGEEQAWSSGGEEVPCLVNLVPVEGGRDVIGAISIGHAEQGDANSVNSITTRVPVITSSMSRAQVTVTAYAPYGYGLTPSVTLQPSNTDDPEITVFSTDGNWPLVVKSGYRNSVVGIVNNYKPSDDNLTARHQYVVRLARTPGGLLVQWYVGTLPGSVDSTDSYLYAERVVPFFGGMPTYKLTVSLIASKNDHTRAIVTTDSYLSIVDMSVTTTF
ncbi:hypothetical protein [Paraburkholderia aspalathi]|uniref:hypothetical protein n=1 Tax=Paraburkholderia aspalathi TaxID=1324617 RepID=UPI0038BDA8BF